MYSETRASKHASKNLLFRKA